MNTVIYEGGTRFKKFYLKNLFTNELEECDEADFDAIVIKYRDAYELQYDGNSQNFLIDGVVEARRER